MLGERLAYLRRREGISQKELGSKLNLSLPAFPGTPSPLPRQPCR